MAAISVRLAASAVSKAGAKCSARIRSNWGNPNGNGLGLSKGLVALVAAGEVMAVRLSSMPAQTRRARGPEKDLRKAAIRDGKREKRAGMPGGELWARKCDHVSGGQSPGVQMGGDAAISRRVYASR